MTVGIYKLVFTDSSFYVGKSVNIESRYKDHISLLKRKASGSPKLQKKYNELQQVPELVIIEETTISSLSEKEVYWIETLSATVKGLNVLYGGQDTMVGEKHPGSKYSNSQIHLVMEMLASTTPIYSHVEIEEATKVRATTVKDVVCGTSHTWLKEEYPDTYQKMLEVKNLRKSTNSYANLNPQANKKVSEYPLVISPAGKIFNIEHLSNFAKEHGLQASNLSHVLSGRRLHHKGWKLA